MPSDPEFPIPPRIKQWCDDHVNPWIGAIFLGALIQALLRGAVWVHWSLGLIAIASASFYLWALLAGWHRKLYEKYSWAMAGALLLATTLSAVGVFGAISAVIYHFRPDAYTSASAITDGGFMDFYYWHTIDALPGLGIWRAYDVRAPGIQQHGLLAGTVLLGFRVVVLGTILSAVKDWIARKRKPVDPL